MPRGEYYSAWELFMQTRIFALIDSFSQFRRRSVSSLILLLSFVAIFATPSLGQEKYNPDDENIKKTVDSMVAYLKQQGPSGNMGHNVLAALAISESTKRYYGYIPDDDPIVKSAAEQIVELMQAGDWESAAQGDTITMYAPCLALIFLCDLDSKKYKNEIEKLLAFIDSRQQKHGPWGYRHETTIGDTSQVQYVSLAIWVAHQHGFTTRPRWGIGILDWLISTQRGPNFDSTGSGGWGYKDGNRFDTTLSIAAAGASSEYIIADYLGLSEKSVANVGKKKSRTDLPKDVFVHESKTLDGKRVSKRADYDMQKLVGSKKLANDWFDRNFSPKVGQWNYYFLYAFERYAYFRETTEGTLGGRMKNWYDQGVDRIRSQLSSNNGVANLPSGHLAEVDQGVTTSLGVLFLVRSTQVLALGAESSNLKAGRLPTGGNLRKVNGRLVGEEISLSIENLMSQIDNPSDEENLDRLKESYSKITLSNDPDARASQVAQMRGLVTHRKYGPRFVGVRFLTNHRDLDSVPALIYALSDPAPDIAKMAHDGLRFISRKVDSISLPQDPKPEDFIRVKKQWEDWYLSIRPDGQLLDRN